jgi:hypothetical protein
VREKSKYWLAGIFSLVFLVLLFTVYRDYELSTNKAITEGTIINFKHDNLTYYSIKYEYWVDGKKYIGSCGVDGDLNCGNDKGCVGELFTVYYSLKNPSNSKIDLGQFENHKKTVDFFNIKK